MAQVKFRFAAPKERSLESRREAREYGVTGEQMATRYLEDRGCVILDRNYRRGHQEVDIIALDHGELAVIEVKSRTSEDVLAAEQAVDHRKRQNLIRVANDYVRRSRRTEPLRFDIIAIVGSGATAEIRHTKDAFNIFNY